MKLPHVNLCSFGDAGDLLPLLVKVLTEDAANSNSSLVMGFDSFFVFTLSK